MRNEGDKKEFWGEGLTQLLPNTVPIVTTIQIHCTRIQQDPDHCHHLVR